VTVGSTAIPVRVERTVGRIGWWVLVALTTLLAINHAAGAFLFANSATESLMFGMSAALQILALIVLFIPYRRNELWAWVATWVSIIPVGLVIAFGADEIGIFYLATAAVMTLAQLVTLPNFRERE
jgi:hypothetical protein